MTETQIKKSLRLKKLLLDARLNQTQIAHNLGVSVARVNHTVQFRRTTGPGVDYIRNGITNLIKHRLGVDISDIWRDEESQAA